MTNETRTATKDDDRKVNTAKAALVAAAQFGAAMLERFDDDAALERLGVMAGTGRFSVTVSDALSPKPAVRLSWTSPKGDTVILGAVEFEFKGGMFMPAGRLN